MLSKRNQFKHKDTDRLKIKWWGKIPHANTNKNKTEVTINIKKNLEQGILPGMERKSHNNKVVKSSKRYNNPKCICI